MSGYIKPLKRPPKNPSTGKKKTLLGLRREAALNEWVNHAMDEHAWGRHEADFYSVMYDCPDCADFQKQLKESEEWR